MDQIIRRVKSNKVKITVFDEDDELVCEFKVNPTNTKLLGGFQKFAEWLNSDESDKLRDEMNPFDFDNLIAEKMKDVIGEENAKTAFKDIGPMSLIGDDHYIIILLNVLEEAINKFEAEHYAEQRDKIEEAVKDYQ